MVLEVEELFEGALVIWEALFDEFINFCKLNLCDFSFRVEWIKEVSHAINRKELLLTLACPVSFVNLIEIDTTNRLCIKVGFNIYSK